jgi:hypothetical protein
VSGGFFVWSQDGDDGVSRADFDTLPHPSRSTWPLRNNFFSATTFPEMCDVLASMYT